MYLHGKIGSFLFRMGTIENIAHYSKNLFSVFCSRILANIVKSGHLQGYEGILDSPDTHLSIITL
jgi:hypothetical protein